MVEILWEFEVKPEFISAFEDHYGPNGTWAKLFRKSDQYVSTILLRDHQKAGRYLTIDRWLDHQSFPGFKSKFADEYQRLDSEMEGFTRSEKRIGVFDVLS